MFFPLSQHIYDTSASRPYFLYYSNKMPFMLEEPEPEPAPSTLTVHVCPTEPELLNHPGRQEFQAEDEDPDPSQSLMKDA